MENCSRDGATFSFLLKINVLEQIMRIDPNGPIQPSPLNQGGDNRSKGSAKRAPESDSYTPSSDAKALAAPQIALIKAFLDSVPEVRAEKVEAAIRNVANKAYEGKEEQVAEKLIGLYG